MIKKIMITILNIYDICKNFPFLYVINIYYIICYINAIKCHVSLFIRFKKVQ